MRVLNKEREERAWRSLRDGNFETRVEPNRTDGEGGYFAPPLWLNEAFATAKRASAPLAGLIPNKFDLPSGISSVNVPVLTTGVGTAPVIDTAPVLDVDIADTSASSAVVTFASHEDVPLQLLEQSPAGAMIDQVIAVDLASAQGAAIESALLTGGGSTLSQLSGVVGQGTSITYNSGSPTATGMWTYFGQMAAQLGDARLLPPEAWLMRTARWSWLSTSADSQNRPLGISSPFFLGSDEVTPDPVGGLVSWPVFLDDNIPATLGTGANQDQIVLLRPSDLILMEGAPVTTINREPLSGSLGVRIESHTRVAAITSRYTSGIFVLGGTGCAVQSGF
jgi:HK97 family phage major capsid protein